MAYHIEKTIAGSEIVIDGFENGIADSPYEGIADIRNANILSAPRQSAVEFATVGVTLPPSGISAVAFSANASTNTITWAGGATFYTGMAITINSVSGAGGITNGRTYYIGNVTATTFKLYSGLQIGSVGLVDITVDVTGTFTVPTFGIPADSTYCNGDNTNSVGEFYKFVFIMTQDGYVWYLSPLAIPDTGGGIVAQNSLQFLGNIGHSTVVGNNTGLVVYKGYLFAFMQANIDYISITNAISSTVNPSANWHYAWKTTDASFTGHRAISATDDAVYFCNSSMIGSILEVAGATFDPTNAATYTYTTNALDLPNDDSATCLAQLGTNLLVGGSLNYIYPWDRISTSFAYPLIVAENFIKCIVSTNSSAYIFAGDKGFIYLTNGSNIDVFKKFPDLISGTVDPYYSWGWAIYFKNQLFFSISGTDNSSNVISNFAGIWAIDLKSGALRMSNSLSYGTYAGTVPVLIQMGNIRATGDGIYAGWLNSTGGVDYTSGTPYTNFQTFIDTDIISVGTFLTKNTFSNIEFKLAKPLVSGEQIRISQRSTLTGNFTVVGTTTTAGMISDVYTANFETVQWLQFRIESNSTASNPSYVPLREIRLRKQ